MGYIYYPALYFTTASIYRKRPLLQDSACKEIVLETFHYLCDTQRVYIFAFVLMSNHLHLIWQMREGIELPAAQHSLLSYTSKVLLRHLGTERPFDREHYLASRSDRTHQVWNDRSLSIPLTHDRIFEQKFHYIHQNPVEAGLVSKPEHYQYSSYRSYLVGIPDWSFLTLW